MKTQNNFKPILFSTEMVQADLGIKKKQTRRLNGLSEINLKPDEWKSNPWVWVYDFEKIEKPLDFLP